MANFTERLTLLIDANATGALNVIKGFGTNTQAEMTKLETAAGTSGGNAGKAFGTQMQAQTLLAVAGIQAAVGGLALTAFGKSAVQDAVDLARANAGLAAELKGVGTESGVTGADIDTLAAHIQKTQVIFETTTKAAATVLLPLTQIRNEVGQGNDIFNRTLEVAAGVSNVLGKDLTSATLQLGKALENPITGVLALNRAGIPLSQTVREQVLLLAKHGDLLGSQRTLLDDLSNRYVAAGSAIAKADPFQQFNVEMTSFKTSVGKDLLPSVTFFLKQGEEILGVFEHLPAPIRTTTEALAALALVGLPLVKVVSVLNSIQAASAAVSAGAAGGAAGGAGAAATAAAASDETLVAAQSAVAESTVVLIGAQEDLAIAQAAVGEGATFDITQMGALAEADTAAAAAAAAHTAAEEELAAALAARAGAGEAAGVSTGATIGGLLAGVAGGALIGNAIVNNLKGSQPAVNDYEKSLSALAKTGDLSGVALRSVGEDAKHLAGDMKLLQESNFQRIFTGGVTGAIGAKADIKSLNDALIQLGDTEGPQAMTLAIGHLGNELIQAGVSSNTFGSELDPAIQHLDDLRANADAAAGSVVDLTTAFGQVSQAASFADENYKIADSIDAYRAAGKQLAADQADAAGTGDKAVAANKAVRDSIKSVADADQALADAHVSVTDSYNKLDDAQAKVTDSIIKLHEAQQAYDEYNSARGARERELQLDILRRRVVTTPVEAEQKQLDLLNLQDQNRQKQQSAADTLRNAQRGVVDAQRGVADAQRSIADAELHVRDATVKVADAEDAVRVATEKRKKVHDDAAAAIITDERKVGEAYATVIGGINKASQDQGGLNDELQNYLTQLGKLAQIEDPYNPLTKGLEKYLQLQLSASSLAGSGRVPVPANVANLGALFPVPSTPAVSGKLTPDQLAAIYASGQIPTHKQIYGYGAGGVVPGPIGVPRFAVVHGGEEIRTPAQQGGNLGITQNNHFYGDSPSLTDLDYANRQLGWRLARTGRN